MANYFKTAGDIASLPVAGAGIWLTLEHVSLVVGLLAGLASLGWTIYRIITHKAD